ncbi:MAG: hypothetical protein Kow0022_07190 [Phycisphaerales bacterium]
MPLTFAWQMIQETFVLMIGMRCRRLAAGVALSVALSAHGQEGLRIASWNISNYAGGRQADLQTAIYGSFEGRSMSPDVLVCQEILSQSAADALLAILNSAPGSPGDWASGPFLDGPDTDSALFYRTSKIEFLGIATLPADPGTSGAPRDVRRYDIGLIGYEHPSTHFSIYSVHMKAGSSSSDQARRLVEATRIRDDAETLDPAINIAVMGDFNVQSSTQAAYQELVGIQANNNGRFADPIGTPGTWNNNSSFRFVHTQDPSGSGGMDDRHDQILLDPSLGDGVGLEYRGQFGAPYSTTTWNDPNHSYRAWGNDGTSYNTTMRTTGNTMVGPSIAAALINVASGGGHLPVFADFIVPGQIAADAEIDLGQVPFGAEVTGLLHVGNGADVGIWGVSGIAAITYALSADAGITIDPGPFADAAGGTLNEHSFTAALADDPNGGIFEAQIHVSSDDVDRPIVQVRVVGQIVGCTASDLAVPFGTLDFFDVQAFLQAFSSHDPLADFTHDNEFDFFDVQEFLQAFSSGCP